MKITFVLFVLLLSFSQASGQAKPGRDSGGRAKYIIENVAMCVECHTPRDETGRLIRKQYLNGAPVPVKGPSYPGMKWAVKAPAISKTGFGKSRGLRFFEACYLHLQKVRTQDSIHARKTCI